MGTRFKFLIVAAAAALAASSVSAETLRLATEGTYPPFNFVAASGELQGFDIDIAKALCAEMAVECKIETFSWDGMIPGLNAGKFDAIVASMSITEKRKEAVNFTQPYYQAGAVIVAAKGQEMDTSPKGLAGKVIGVQRASSYGQLLKAQFPEAVIREYDKNEEHNLDLAAGRIDGVMAQRLFMQQWLDSEEGANFEPKGKPFFDTEYLGPGAGIAIRKSDQALQERFDAALKTIMENGVYDEINNRYFPFSLKPGQEG
ncbi:transporter substrate-binding domain-containing protein [Mycoplana sp. BE70]|uniref:transporter substrate-binding domain-containing protein n=1 Tax=Mycoplana sp. BE70 TaxID=2817775 RepID=UPI00286AAF50|nr:transporter substrate-binding domain-containing protein [Mycoplana sp. BE70]